MKKILENSKIQNLLSVVILFFSFIISSLQGVFGFWIPFLVLILLVLIVILIYYVISIPLLDAILKNKNANNTLSVEELQKYEETGDFKEIWIVTSNLEMAANSDGFAQTIKRNVHRNIQYKFFISNDAIASERAKNLLSMQKKNRRNPIKFFALDDKNKSIFFDEKIDYDLFLTKDPIKNVGYIGTTVGNQRSYTLMPQGLFINLKRILETTDEIKLE